MPNINQVAGYQAALFYNFLVLPALPPHPLGLMCVYVCERSLMYVIESHGECLQMLTKQSPHLNNMCVCTFEIFIGQQQQLEKREREIGRLVVLLCYP